MKKLLILLLIVSASAYGSEAKIKRLKGKVLQDGKAITSKSILKDKSVIQTKDKSFLIFNIPGWGAKIVLGPNSSMKLDFSKKKFVDQVRFTEGICRWVTSGKMMKMDKHKNHDHKKKGAMGLRTKAAVMGVRGTDFLVVNNSLLGETEIVMFDGNVEFQSATDKADQKVLGPNQWGGIGGRFGSKIGDVLTLPKNIIEAFKSKLPSK